MRNNWLRATVALTAAGALGVGMAGTASADEPLTGVISTEGGWTANGTPKNTEASLIYITPEGGEAVLTYCIDLNTGLKSEYIYQEGAWDESNVANLPKVQWVLHNSYPSVAPEALAEAAGADLTDVTDTERAAYTATQAAVWSLTDGFALNADDAVSNIDDGKETTNAADDAAVAAIYAYLTDNATEMPAPVTEMTFNGPTSGDVSEKLGPFSVTTPGGDAELAIEGGKLVDADDKEVTTVPNGGEFYIIPDDGVAEITVTGTATVTVPTGTVFLATDELAPEKQLTTKAVVESQKLILAGVIQGDTSAEMKLTITGDNTLPVTGMSLTNSLLVGLALLVAGAIALVIVRRRRVASTWGDAA